VVACTLLDLACNPPRTDVYGTQWGLEVKPILICGRLALVGLLCAFAACGGDGGGSSPPPDGPAQVSTLAYVVTRCHEENGGRNPSLSQALWIRQGDREPVKIVEYALGQFAIDGFCRFFGKSRTGYSATIAGGFPRLGVSPDGSLILFEVTDDFSLNAHVIPEEQQGIFAVRPDGTGLHKVAPHSTDPSFRFYGACPFLFFDAPRCLVTTTALFDFSRDGRRVVYTDLDPTQTGDEAPQVVTLDVVTGERQPVTHLPPLPVSPACVGQTTDCVFPSIPPVRLPTFLGATTIAFERGGGTSVFGGGVFTVKADGTEEPAAIQTVALPDGTLIPISQITGAPYATQATVPGIPENGPSPNAGNTISEAFVIEPPNSALLSDGRVLQLTNYGRSDTTFVRIGNDGQHVFFIASENPLGTNPSEQCQWFSIDRLGGDLRQLTFFDIVGDRRRNCTDPAAPGCSVTAYGELDLITGALMFASTCDPVGSNPNGIEQLFAMRPDGSGLTQLTQMPGMIQHADGSLDVETAGPACVPARHR